MRNISVKIWCKKTFNDSVSCSHKLVEYLNQANIREFEIIVSSPNYIEIIYYRDK